MKLRITPNYLVLGIMAGLFSLVQVALAPGETAHAANVCRVGVSMDISASIDEEDSRNEAAAVASLFANGGLGSQYEVTLMTFGTAASGYTGYTPYYGSIPSAASSPLAYQYSFEGGYRFKIDDLPFMDSYLPAIPANYNRARSEMARILAPYNTVYRTDRPVYPGARTISLRSNGSNLEAGLGYNLSGILPGNSRTPRLAGSGAPSTNGVVLGTTSFRNANVKVLVTDGGASIHAKNTKVPTWLHNLPFPPGTYHDGAYITRWARQGVINDTRAGKRIVGVRVGGGPLAGSIMDYIFGNINGAFHGVTYGYGTNQLGVALMDKIRIACEPFLTAQLEARVALDRTLYQTGDRATLTTSVFNRSMGESRVNAVTDWWFINESGATVRPSSSRKDNLRIASGAASTPVDSIQIPIDDQGLQQVCGRLTISNVPGQRVNEFVPNTRTVCSYIGKLPWLSVTGGDVKTGNMAVGASSVIGNKAYGSWLEYAAIPRGTGAIATAGSLAMPHVRSNGSAPSSSLLMMSNSPTLGNFTALPAIPNSIRSNFATTPDSTIGSTISTAEINTAAAAKFVKLIAPGNLTIKGGAQIEKPVVIYARGSVTIENDITYKEGSYASLGSIPQLIIIADGDIIIRDSVKQIDAWLESSKTISTCNAPVAGVYYTGLKRGVCGEKLVINGPMIADRIQFRRTFGGGNDDKARGEVAEAVNMRSDAYLWGYGQSVSGNNATIRTTHITELPPRY